MIDLNLIHVNDKNPRTISKKNFEKLKNSIKDFPKMLELRPIVIKTDGTILGGNMRFLAIKDLGLELKDEWFKVADKLTIEEEKRFIVEDNVSFGEWDSEMLANEWDRELLDQWGIDVGEWDELKEYSRIVTAPVYTPNGEKPLVKDLYNRKKLDELINEIDKTNIPEEDKEFLKLSAHRHVVFSYQDIAEYYSHSNKEVQELMEKSALVIIDFDKAINNGFVELVSDLMEIQEEDYDK